MRRTLKFALGAVLLTGTTHAQVTYYVGPSPNITTVLDFDNPFVASGPIGSSDPAFTNVGINSINLIGSTVSNGDTLTGASNVNGQVLVYDLGVLAVAGDGEPLDDFNAASGFEINLAAPVDEFEALFADQINLAYDVEVLMGATTVGSANFFYAGAYPAPPHYWRGASQFDTVRITFPAGAPGIGLDEIGFGSGPGPIAPGNDDCANATAATLGVNPLSNLTATDSGQVSTCVPTGGNDVWYSYTATSTMDLRIRTCGSDFDSFIEVYSGSCGNLTTVACNDDYCGTQSRVLLTNVNVGDTFLIQVGGWMGLRGSGSLDIVEYDIPDNCARTMFGSNNGGNIGGAVYYDITVTQNVSFSGLLTNTGEPAGNTVGLSVYTAPMTSIGNEGIPGAWTLVAEDDGTSLSAGDDFETAFTFVAPFNLSAGTYGIAIVGDNPTTGFQLDHEYTNGTGSNQNADSADGVVSLDLGSASNVPFTGPIFTPRVWNGQMCHGIGTGPGTNYCVPNPNSTGVAASMGASGTAVLANNDLVLESSDMPNNSFAYFLTSQTQAMTPNPGGSAGVLCVGGSVGRYVGPGQIQNTMSSGAISLAIDSTMHPTPTGFVQIMSGETWNFTCWFRDSSPMGATSNFADGLEVTFN